MKKQQVKFAKQKAPRQRAKTGRQDDDLVCYAEALRNPFSERAIGARVPDMYGAPTTTLRVRATHTVTVNNNGTATMVVFPNVACSAVLFTGTSPEFNSLTVLDNSVVGTYWGTDLTTFSARVQNYRIVGMGVRVTGLSSMTNSQGKLIMGATPIDSYLVAKQFTVGGVVPATNAAITKAATMNAWGIPNTAGNPLPSLLIAQPGFNTVSMLEATENEFDIIPHPVDPRAFEFRASNDDLIGFESTGTIAANDNVSGNASYLHLSGFEACYLSVVGAVNNTTTFDVEIVYHIEGRQQITGLTDQSHAVPPSAQRASPTKPLAFMQIVEAATHEPVVREVVEYAAGMIHPFLGKIASVLSNVF